MVEVGKIVILCRSYLDACDAFDCFMDFLESHFPYHIIAYEPYANQVTLADDLCYVFADQKYIDLFQNPKNDILDSDIFFENVERYTDCMY